MANTKTIALGIFGLGVAVTGGIYLAPAGKTGVPKKKPAPVIVDLVPIPPPTPATPPPPKEEPPPEQKEPEMVEETPVPDPPDEPVPAPPELPKLGTNLQGNGPGMAGLGGSGNGGGTGGPGSSVVEGTRFRAYGKSLGETIHAALKADPQLRKANVQGTLLVYVDRSTGQVTRAKLIDASGSKEEIARVVAAATGKQIPGTPSPDMPLPVRLKIDIRPPSL